MDEGVVAGLDGALDLTHGLDAGGAHQARERRRRCMAAADSAEPSAVLEAALESTAAARPSALPSAREASSRRGWAGRRSGHRTRGPRRWPSCRRSLLEGGSSPGRRSTPPGGARRLVGVDRVVDRELEVGAVAVDAPLDRGLLGLRARGATGEITEERGPVGDGERWLAEGPEARLRAALARPRGRAEALAGRTLRGRDGFGAA